MTRFAILGQLALREWSAYELTASMRRTLRWFWPRAESVIYAEARRLEELGLAEARAEPSAARRGRNRTVYAITPAGRRALRGWLAEDPTTLTQQSEHLLRVHLARFGTLDDLERAIAWAGATAEELLQVADTVATEFVEGRHIFQGEAHIRGLLFDGLLGQAQALHDWAEAARFEVARWPSVEADDAARQRAVRRMRTHLTKRRGR